MGLRVGGTPKKIDIGRYAQTNITSMTVDVQEVAKAFAALGDPVRLRLFLTVARRSDETCACELIEPSGRSQPTVSHHMKVLVDSGLLQRTKRGQWVWYRANPDHLAALGTVLCPDEA